MFALSLVLSFSLSVTASLVRTINAGKPVINRRESTASLSARASLALSAGSGTLSLSLSLSLFEAASLMNESGDGQQDGEGE